MNPLMLLTVAALAVVAPPQDRDAKVRGDRDTFADSDAWIYNDLDAGLREAGADGRPLMVVVRCIPCENCQEFDDDVARRDPAIRDLMDRFVCVRIVKANTLDLSKFQYDYDQSMAIVFLAADGTVLGRYGTRSDRPEEEDVSVEGLRHAMEEALRLARSLEALRPSLAGKQPRPVEYRTPLDYPSLAGKYGSDLDYQGAVARSCLHCHQVREAERHLYRDAGRPIPDEVLFPYPDPSVLGLEIDPDSLLTAERVEDGSIADRAGIEPGDRLAEADGQPLVSTADLQWVLHTTPSGPATIPVVVIRDGERQERSLDLPADWRTSGNISWRVTTWDLRRMAFGGLRLSDLPDDRRDALGLPADSMALLVDHVGQYGEHAIAKNAGFLKGDLIVAFDGLDRRMDETDLIAHSLQDRRPGDLVEVAVLRDGDRQVLTLELP